MQWRERPSLLPPSSLDNGPHHPDGFEPVLAAFFEDRFQQSVIGLVVGTFTYSLLVLGSLGGWGLDESWEAIPTEAIEELATVHGEDDLDRFATFGSYTGWRTAIDEDGEWLFLVAGD